MIKFLLALILVALIAIYELIIMPYICVLKINKFIEALNGEVLEIKKISLRDKIYLVDYKTMNIINRLNVKFNIFCKGKWY